MAKPKINTLLLVVAFLSCALAVANFYVERNNERAGRLQAEEELALVKKAKEALEEEHYAERAARLQAEEELGLVKVAKELLEKEREEWAQAKQALEKQVASLGTQAKALADRMAQEKQAREALTAKVAEAQATETSSSQAAAPAAGTEQIPQA